jgi:hypothetical protein
MLRLRWLGLAACLTCVTACTTPSDPTLPEVTRLARSTHPANAQTAAPASSTRASGGAASSTLPLHFIRSNECNGELVELTGVIHLVSHLKADGTVVGHFNYQRVVGRGLTSGLRYHAAAVDHFRLPAPFPSSIHSVRSFRLISEGASSNPLVQVLFHLVVDAQGRVVAEIDELRMNCR